jgi:hypothetical protein
MKGAVEMTVEILFDNGCSTKICARYSHKLKMPFTTLQILQNYLEDHHKTEWISKIEFAEDFVNRIIGAESDLAVIDGVWNKSGWQENDEFFNKDKIVKEIPFIDLNWNWR